ncbi:MAG: DnaD domain protein [Sedimentibacter sp.]|uniref:DnaD domain-containing protein n=1 Tax=Sedimentibacter sp. TaxID=1960295 RepID=UPI0029829066|nr:DnaD domain protein [Sedimentibacter sp.]MDW5299396.1 DnaD domain protein [Sedimentibacter sp.]
MYFILQEMKIDLGDTPIENIFINDYMPGADGTYVKVYLLGYKYAKDKQQNFNNATIAKNLKLPLSDVLNAWTYWEKEGIIIKHETDDEYNYIIEFVNLKQFYIDNVYKYIAKSIPENNNYIDNNELVSFNRGSDNKKMMEEIEEMFGRPLKINEKQKIVTWLNTYKMKTDIMTQAFSYCINNKKVKKFNYIESVVSAWHDEGVNDIDTMVEYLEKRNDRFSMYSRISKSLGFIRTLTEAEMKTIDRWFDEWGFSLEMILRCLENSTKINNPNINYFDKILSEWYKNGFKTIEDLKNDKKPEVKMKPSKETAKTKNKFHNFIQSEDYSGEDIENIARKRFENKLNKLGLKVPEEGDGSDE